MPVTAAAAIAAPIAPRATRGARIDVHRGERRASVKAAYPAIAVSPSPDEAACAQW
nr:hypothetical protein [Jatrophihabitans endophyticus]